MIDRTHIGAELPGHTVEVEPRRLRLFSEAIGEAEPVTADEAAAGAGPAPRPVPPTFLFTLELERPGPFDWLTSLGVDLSRILHGEQSFVYHAPVLAGDRVTFAPRISDIQSKKGGALELLVRETIVTNQTGARVATLRSVLAVRNG